MSAQPAADGQRSRRTALAAALATTAGTLLLACAYALAVPLGASPDEPDHWRFAYAVQTGQDMSDGELTVPVSLSGFPAACVNEQPDADASCAAEIRPAAGVTETTTHISSYPRLYYLLVGRPLALRPAEGGVIASRLLSALLSALLWGVAMLPWSGRGAWPVRVAILLTATPAALFFSGSINPQGLEIAVFAALWSLTAALLSRLGEGGYRRLPRWLQVAWPLCMVVAVNTRLLSAWFLAILLVTCALWFRPSLRRLLRDRRAVGVAVVVAVAVAVRVYAMLWRSSSGGLLGTGGGQTSGMAYGDLVVSAVWRVLDNPADAIGLLGWLDTPLPSGATVVWFVIAGGIAFLAAPLVRGRHLAALAFLLACLLGTWIALDPIMTDLQSIPFWQARYGFPLWMGVPVLAAALMATVPGDGAAAPVVALHRAGCAAGYLVLQVLALGYLMVRYMWPAGWFGPVGDARWLPYAPSLVVAAIGVFGALVLAWPLLVEPGASTARGDADASDRDRRNQRHTSLTSP